MFQKIQGGLVGLLQYIYTVINEQGIVRRCVLGVTVYMTYTATTWAENFANVTARSGLDAAAIIAAVTAPLMALQGFAFKQYLDSRNKEQDNG